MAVETLLQIQTKWVITTGGTAIITGTGRVQVYDVTPRTDVLFLSTYELASLTLITNQFILQYKRVILTGSNRITMQVNSQLIITNFTAVGRVTIAGRGL